VKKEASRDGGPVENEAL
jgi:hypothetical protein